MTNQFKLIHASVFSAVLTISGLPAQAVAQESAFSLEEIIVTARKVEESLQEVPLSITAFTSEDLAEQSIEELEDIAMSTVGLVFEDYSNGGYATPVIRGASQLSITQLEQNVSTFIDGVYIPRQYAVDIGTLDLAQVEVVKGPQSSLYGSNAFVGAINYVTKKPNFDGFGADVSVTLGTDEREDFSVGLNIPVIEDVLAVRLGASSSEFEGDWANNHPDANAGVSPGTDGNIGGWDKETYEIGVAIRPSETVSIDLAYHNYDTLSETRAQARLSAANPGDMNCSSALLFGFPTTPLFCGELPDEPVPGASGLEGFVVDPRTFGLDSESELLRGSFAVDLSEQARAVYQYSNIKGEVFSAGTSDRDVLVGTTLFFPVFAFGNVASILPVGEFDYKSHELRVEFDLDSGMYAMIGAFTQDGEDFDGGGFAVLPFRDLEPVTGGTINVSQELAQTDVDAVFGRVQLPLMDDKITVSVEARYGEEEKFVDDGSNSFTYETDYFTPRVSVDYSFGEDRLAYISAAKGVKAGGVNGSTFADLLDEERFYDDDENWTYEIGSKNTFFEGQLQLNAAIYYIDWSNLQVSQTPTGAPIGTTTILRNLGAAESKGIEIELDYAATDNFTIDAGITFINAEYSDGTISARVEQLGFCDDIVCNANGDIGGNELARSSDVQWNIGAMYDGMIGDNLDFFVRGDLVGQSDQYVSELNTATIPSRALLNLRAGVSQGPWSAELWAKNATDEEYVSNSFFFANSFQFEYVPTWGNKRRVGLTLDYSF